MAKFLALRVREEVKRFLLLDLLGVLIGIVGGIGAIIFLESIKWINIILFGIFLPYVSFYYGDFNLGIIILPAIGGLFVGPIVAKVSEEAKGHGVPEVMEALRLRGGVIRKRVALAKIIASSITIGSGGSAGREGPMAQIGAGFGSILADLLKLGEKERRLVVVAGLSAGIAGAFNAPLGGALFGIEILMGGLTVTGAITVILASVVGAAMVQAYYGIEPVFPVPTNLTFTNPAELVLYAVFGLVMGFIAVFWVKLFYLIEDIYVNMKVPEWIKPAIGGLATGITGFMFMGYGVLGGGYNGMQRLWFKAGVGFTLGLLLLLAVLKIIATGNTIGSGGSGGVFSPSLYIGAMAGAAFGFFFYNLIPGMISNPLTYSIVGMGAVFAAAAYAPITMIVMVPEMTGDYSLLPPMMVACSISYLVARIIMGDSSIYLLKLKRKGIIFIPKVDLEVLGFLPVRDFMTREVITVTPDTDLEKVYKYVATRHHNWYPVVEDGKLVGVVTSDDILGIPPYMLSKHKVKDVMDKKLLTIREDESIKDAIEKMHALATTKLLVVSKDDPRKLVGIITKTDVLKAYEYISSL